MTLTTRTPAPISAAYARRALAASNAAIPNRPTITVRHVDTCLPCFVTDHHNRPGEMLCGVPVARGTRVYQVRDDLIDEAAACCRDDLAEMVESSQHGLRDLIAEAVLDAFEGTHPLKAFDRTLEPAGDDDGESCYAWFLVTYEAASPAAPDTDAMSDDAYTAHLVAQHAARRAGLIAQQQAQQPQAQHAAPVAPATPATPFADYAAQGPAQAEAAPWLEYVSDATRCADGVAGFDASVTEAIDTLLRRGVITARAGLALFNFFDVAPLFQVGSLATAMVAQVAQQPQARDTRADAAVTFEAWRASGRDSADLSEEPAVALFCGPETGVDPQDYGAGRFYTAGQGDHAAHYMIRQSDGWAIENCQEVIYAPTLELAENALWHVALSFDDMNRLDASTGPAEWPHTISTGTVGCVTTRMFAAPMPWAAPVVAEAPPALTAQQQAQQPQARNTRGHMTRRAYYDLCLRQPVKWLAFCAANPGPYMRPRHVALIKLAIRNGGGR